MVEQEEPGFIGIEAPGIPVTNKNPLYPQGPVQTSYPLIPNYVWKYDSYSIAAGDATSPHDDVFFTLTDDLRLVFVNMSASVQSDPAGSLHYMHLRITRDGEIIYDPVINCMNKAILDSVAICQTIAFMTDLVLKKGDICSLHILGRNAAVIFNAGMMFQRLS
jgi:hypothetical protein